MFLEERKLWSSSSCQLSIPILNADMNRHHPHDHIVYILPLRSSLYLGFLHSRSLKCRVAPVSKHNVTNSCSGHHHFQNSALGKVVL